MSGLGVYSLVPSSGGGGGGPSSRSTSALVEWRGMMSLQPLGSSRVAPVSTKNRTNGIGASLLISLHLLLGDARARLWWCSNISLKGRACRIIRFEDLSSPAIVHDF